MSLADCIDGLGKGRRWVVASVRDLAAAGVAEQNVETDGTLRESHSTRPLARSAYSVESVPATPRVARAVQSSSGSAAARVVVGAVESQVLLPASVAAPVTHGVVTASAPTTSTTDCPECRRGEHMPDGSACSCCKTDLTEYLAAFNAAMSPVTA